MSVCEAGRSVVNSGVISRSDPGFFGVAFSSPTSLSRACRFSFGPDGPLGPRQTPFSPIENAIAKVWILPGPPGPSGPSGPSVCLPVHTYIRSKLKKNTKKVYY